MFGSTVNVNPETGIRYGIISAHCLDSYIVQSLMYEEGEDLSYKEACEEIEKEVKRKYLLELQEEHIIDHGGEPWDDPSEDDEELEPLFDEYELERRIENACEYIEIEEPHIEGVYKDVHYATSWLGGALNFFIFKSPHTVKAKLCSPCVPNCGFLDDDEPYEDGYECYTVPADWRHAY